MHFFLGFLGQFVREEVGCVFYPATHLNTSPLRNSVEKIPKKEGKMMLGHITKIS